MYEIALSVTECLRAGTQVDVAWAVETHGFSSRAPAEALAITPDGTRIGRVLSGSLDDQLADLSEQGATGRLVDLRVGEVDAIAAGLACGGDARCLLLPAVDLPADLWPRLRDREPICLVTRLDGAQVLGTDLFSSETIADAGPEIANIFGRGASRTLVSTDSVLTVLWPVPKLVLVGSGEVADALAAAAGLLGWSTQTLAETSAAGREIAGLAAVDKLIVISHDLDTAGPALAAALDGQVGYIGALGSRRTQQSRADWLAQRGITDLTRIHGPAGLDIGAGPPAEIAVSILAEALAVRTGATATSLRERPGSIH
ncbi:MAG: xanthine dehydrogenase accessory factor [Pseudonocardiales bacterium]|nr:xanthine dehydrogenase accessory factor [Pseudonocardiales bacterium]